MFRESTDSPFDLASREEIDNWTARPDGEAASSVFFKPDLDAPPGTPWNRSHVRVFVRTFLDADTFECVNQERIKRAFISHLKALRQKYKIQQSSHEEQAQRQDRANRDERKRNVCIFCFHPSVLPKLLYAFSYSNAGSPSHVDIQLCAPTCKCYSALVFKE